MPSALSLILYLCVSTSKLTWIHLHWHVIFTCSKCFPVHVSSFVVIIASAGANNRVPRLTRICIRIWIRIRIHARIWSFPSNPNKATLPQGASEVSSLPLTIMFDGALGRYRSLRRWHRWVHSLASTSPQSRPLPRPLIAIWRAVGDSSLRFSAWEIVQVTWSFWDGFVCLLLIHRDSNLLFYLLLLFCLFYQRMSRKF